MSASNKFNGPDHFKWAYDNLDILDIWSELGVEGEPKRNRKSPFRTEKKASFSVSPDGKRWEDHGINEKGDVGAFIAKALGGRSAAYKWIGEKRGMNGAAKEGPPSRVVSEDVHEYQDADGVHCFDVVITRREDGSKGVYQRRPDDKGGWILNVPTEIRTLYHLPQLLASDGPVRIVEGEKDVESLERHGAVATCNPGGVGKWRAEYSQHLRDRDVIIFPDNDDQGRKHAQEVARFLHGIARSVRIVNWSAVWPTMPTKADITDALENGITLEDIEAVAEEWEPSSDTECTATSELQDPVYALAEPIISADAFKLNDTGAAVLFAALNGENLRFVRSSQTWMFWDGGRWIPNAKEVVMQMAMQLPGVVYGCAARINGNAQADFGKWAIKLGDEVRIKATLSLAQNLPGVPVDAGDLDTDPYIVGLSNGVIDLRSGEFRAARPEDLITKSLGTHYHHDATCPTWERFLDQVFEGDPKLVSYLQEAVGYCLTGSVKEQCLFFAYGSGSNGKTTLFETLEELAGDYGQRAPKSLFTKNPRGGTEQTNDLARLPGVRILFGSEVEDGCAMAESKVKDLTGGDTITARLHYKEFFDFKPTHKLLMFGNYKPRISGTDNGIWRRIRLIPFTRRFEGEEKDPDLAEKLRAELPGILNWAIEGCGDWQKNGLQTPGVVEKATSEYRNQEDVVGEFLAEEYIVTRDHDHTIPKKELYNGYKAFCEANGYSPLGVRRFNEQVLTRSGIESDRVTSARIYRGIHYVELQ